MLAVFERLSHVSDRFGVGGDSGATVERRDVAGSGMFRWDSRGVDGESEGKVQNHGFI